MKKVIMLIACVLMYSSVAMANIEGLYVSPKSIFSNQIVKDSQLKLNSEMFDSQSFDFNNDYNHDLGMGLALGYDLNDSTSIPVRSEVEYTVRMQSKDSYSISDDMGSVYGSTKYDIEALFVNTYLDYHNKSDFTPYVGFGLGVAFIETNANFGISALGENLYDSSAKHRQTNFAYNVGLGVDYEINKNLALDLGYRFVDFGDVETGDNGFDEISVNGESHVVAHETMMGLRYTF